MKKHFTFTDYLIEREKKQRKVFKNYLKYAMEIKKIAKREVRDPKVIVFGSILRKNEIPQDIDILIISPDFQNHKKKGDFLVKMWKKFGSFAPFEFHLITEKNYQEWYKNFIKEKIEV